MQEVVNKENGVVVCAWYDNKRVITASSFVGKLPIGKCSRYDRKEHKSIEVPCRASVETYNQYMGGVDKADTFAVALQDQMQDQKMV